MNTKTLSLKEVARECFKEADGDIMEATKVMAIAVKNDQELFRALMEPLLTEACYSIVSSMGRSRNQAIWAAAETGRAVSQKAAIVALGEGLLGWMVLGKKPLGECKNEDLAEAIKHYDDQAHDMQSKSDWMRLVVAANPKNKKIKQVLTHEKLEELQKKARGNA